jgi:hypothetical protein
MDFWDFLGDSGCIFWFLGFLGRFWVLFSAILWVSGISWENLEGFRDFLGEPWWK